ncbi:unnamed protein product, partial [Mesorhabditis belari]|uniref:Uncharacterized protein n=1 Tax=Mesorhabditis belari TaxID=2138241 RepID=A0AAF3J3C2_9BILA
MASRIARAADRFIVPGLKSRCEAFLINDLAADKVSERLKTAYELQMNVRMKKSSAHGTQDVRTNCGGCLEAGRKPQVSTGTTI